MKGLYFSSILVKMVHAAISCNTALQHTSNQARTKLKPDRNYSLFLSGTLYSQVSKHLAIYQREKLRVGFEDMKIQVHACQQGV